MPLVPVPREVPRVAALKLWYLPGLLLMASLALAQPPRQAIRSGPVTVYYDSRDETFARQALEAANAALPMLESALGLPASNPPPIRIDIARTSAAFNSLAGAEMKPWTQGVALADQRRIVLRTLLPRSMKTVTAHELTHVLLDQEAARYGAEPPRWLHEGLAKYSTDDFSPEDRQLLGEAIVQRRLLAISQLDKAFSGKQEQVALAYAESYTLVRFLHELRGGGGLSEFLHNLGLTGDVSRAFVRTYGLTTEQLQERWLSQVRSEYLSQGLSWSIETVIFLAMGILFLLVYSGQLRKRREIRERMQEEERLRGMIRGTLYDDESDEDIPPHKEF